MHLAFSPRTVFPFMLLCCTLSAQDPAATAPDQASVPAPANPGVAQTDPDKHVFGVLPNYRTAPDGGAVQTLTWKQKFKHREA